VEQRVKRLVAVLACVLALAACQPPNGDDAGGEAGTGDVPKGCSAVDVASSPEKVELLTQLAASFNTSKDAKEGGCVVVRVQRKSSGAGATALVNGWTDEEAEGPKPVIWSPAAASWVAIVNHQLTAKGERAIAPANAKSFMLTPLVIAMPRPMAQALGWPDTPIGYSDLLALAQNPEGWASKGHPEWGAFKLGKTNPNFSTSALSATIAQYYAATGKQRDLTLEDINRPEVTQFNQGVESSVVHYGDITLTFLNNWYRNDARGTALTYVSAVAVEEKSVIDYNRGNPDGITDPGERPKPPKVPLVAIYPKEGTLFSDSPFFVLDAPWVSPSERSGAERFGRYVQQPANQRKILRFGFRPGNPAVAVASPIERSNGVDPTQPQTTLGLPAPPVLVRLIERWGETRKAARVLLVMDVSGSMADDAGNGESKLDLAKRAAIEALAQFKADDLVGVRIFSTHLQAKEPTDYIDLVPIAAVAAQREKLGVEIGRLIPREGTPLFTVAKESYKFMKDQYDPTRINAVLLLTDGHNDDERNDDVTPTLAALRAGSEGLSSSPVRVFTIAYGRDADKETLKRMADATNAAAYDASDPQTISKVFTAVVSNF
jgi:Ca-activated chloride channel family protein